MLAGAGFYSVFGTSCHIDYVNYNVVNHSYV